MVLRYRHPSRKAKRERTRNDWLRNGKTRDGARERSARPERSSSGQHSTTKGKHRIWRQNKIQTQLLSGINKFFKSTQGCISTLFPGWRMRMLIRNAYSKQKSDKNSTRNPKISLVTRQYVPVLPLHRSGMLERRRRVVQCHRCEFWDRIETSCEDLKRSS